VLSCRVVALENGSSALERFGHISFERDPQHRGSGQDDTRAEADRGREKAERQRGYDERYTRSTSA
jgi:hypothetical protein